MKLSGRRSFRGDFKARVFMKFFVLIIAVSFAFTLVFIRHEKRTLSDTLIKNGLALANILAHSSRLGAFSEDPYFLKDPVEALTMEEEVKSVFVFSADGRLLSGQRGAGKAVVTDQKRMMETLVRSRVPVYSEKTDHFEFWAPILSGPVESSVEALFYDPGAFNQKDRAIGFVRIDLSKNILARSFDSLLVRGLFIAAAFLVLSTVIAYIMAKNITMPLNQLTEGVRAIEEGRSALPVPVREDDEIGRLAVAFNTMSEALRERETQLRSLTSRLSLIEERERRQIATDLHDNLGQTLAVAKMKLGTLKGVASSSEAAEGIDKICESIDEAIRYTRSLTSELSPPVLYSFGFVPAVEWLVEQFQEQHGIRLEFRDDGEQKPMDEETRILLFRITRELLFNIVKHSQARNGRVSISKDGNSIQIVVKDNGVGFDAATMFNKVDSFGFFSIRERLKYLGGRLEVDSEPGKGTKVVLSALLKQTE